MRSLLIALIVVLGSAAASFAQPANAAIDALSRGDYTSAIVELRRIEANDHETFRKQSYDYLLARAYELSGDVSSATALYQNVARGGSAAMPYALVHLARLMREHGNLLVERIYLNQLLSLNEPKFSPVARLYLAKNAVLARDERKAIQLLIARNTANRFSRDDTALLGECYLRGGDTLRGRAILTHLIDTAPNAEAPDDASLSSAKNLDSIDGKADIGEAEHLRRAKIYQFNREFASARHHFEAIVANYSNGDNAPSSMLEIARGFSQLGDHVEALKWYERVQERYPETIAAKDALLLGSSAYGRVGKYKEATTRYQRFIDKFPNDERLDRAYLNMIDFARDQGDDSQAQKWAAKTREKFAGKLPETLAIFSEARIFLSRGEWRNAIERLDALEARAELGGSNVPGGTTHLEVRFLRGFASEQLGDYSAAIDQYLAIPDGRNEYYGWRASERLASMRGIEAAQPLILERLNGFIAATRSRSAADRRRAALAALRLTDLPEVHRQAADVLSDAFAKETRASPPERKPSADFAILDNVNGSFAVDSVAALEPAWRRVSAEYPIMLTAPAFRDLYPAPFAPTILRYSGRQNVDPRLILAIMRQESRFAADAKSISAARGLMQFISSAATKTALDVGIESLQQNDLYSPSISIHFGSHYLSQLAAQFPQQSEAVVASYNGGADNMKRWIARSRSGEADRFVAEIQFSQTKDYVQKVMASYRVYRELYDEKLQPRVTN